MHRVASGTDSTVCEENESVKSESKTCRSEEVCELPIWIREPIRIRGSEMRILNTVRGELLTSNSIHWKERIAGPIIIDSGELMIVFCGCSSRGISLRGREASSSRQIGGNHVITLSMVQLDSIIDSLFSDNKAGYTAELRFSKGRLQLNDRMYVHARIEGVGVKFASILLTSLFSGVFDRPFRALTRLCSVSR